jgi:hypothetical protein
MKYWGIIYRTGQEDWETKELLIDDIQYRLVQNALINGEDLIVIKDKPTIKRTAIVSINPADDIVATYQEQGLKIDGLLEPADKQKLLGNKDGGLKSFSDILKEKKEKLFKKMGWKD